MGGFSIWHLISVLFMIANLAMIVHIAVSPRTEGWQKAVWLVAALLIPLIPYLIWLIARPSVASGEVSITTRESTSSAQETEQNIPREFLQRSDHEFTDIQRLNVDEDRIYCQIADELETGSYDKGLWIRLFGECGGDEKQTKVMYIKQRAERLIASTRARVEQAAAEQAAHVGELERIRRELSGLVDPRLAIAVWEGNWATASNLLSDGVKPTGTDENGNSLLDLAEKRGDKQMVRLLQSHGATADHRA
ncbi:hypothetical protein [Azoarcus sp. DN11]|uniref:hypothetical protein n=1 Tax=Azoarcus sp. DN11 TaxID=356837 RepID=UPI000FE22129|nr:hypothetical protein [Azoarcus sp. DN11]